MQIRVQVLAVADPSMRNVFASLESSSARAYNKVSGGAKRSAKESTEAIKAGLKDAAAAQGSAYRQSARVHDEEARVVTKTQAQITREIQRNDRIRAQIRDNTFRKIQRDEEAAERRQAAVARRSGLDSVGERRRTVGAYRDFGRSVAGTAGRGARAVIGGVGEIARGAGVDPSLGGLTQRVIATETLARKATTSGLMAQDRVATSADVDATTAAIHATGNATNTGYADVAAGLEAFTSKSSDLESGKRQLTSLMQLSQATGSNFEDLARAAGAVNQSLEDGPDKAERMASVMRVIAKQGAMGSVEMADLATYMPRISSVSEKFAGDRAQTMAQFGAIAQMGVHSLRSTSAEATSSAAALARDLTGNAGQKRLKAANIDVFADKGHTKMRSVEDIIVDVFKKTKGDQTKLSAMFRNSNSRAAIEAFSGEYNEAGGGQAGEGAIKKAFADFTKTISAEDVASIADLTKNSKAGKAQEMQNRFEVTWASALDRVTPALEKLAPSIGKVADSFASLVVYLAENPGKAIAMALTASVAKAGIGAVLSSALERAIMGGGPGGAGGGSGAHGGALGGGLAGNLLTGLTIAATAVTITAAGVTLIDEAFKAKEKREQEERMKALGANTYADNAVARVERGAVPMDDALAQLQAQKAELEAKIASGEQAPKGIVESNLRGFRDIGNFLSGSGPSFDASTADFENSKNLDTNKQTLENVQNAINALSSKTLTVRVVNMPADGFAVTRTPGDGAPPGRTGNVP